MFDSSRSVGMLERCLDMRVCQKCSKGLRQRRSDLVHIVPGQPIPHPLLCFSAFAEHVCVWLEYVVLLHDALS
jgi:hypothetical protein